MTPAAHQQRIQEIARRLAERLVEHWPDAGAHLNELEDFAERMGQEVQREVNAEVLREEAARKDRANCACPGGGRATFQRFRGLELVV